MPNAMTVLIIVFLFFIVIFIFTLISYHQEINEYEDKLKLKDAYIDYQQTLDIEKHTVVKSLMDYLMDKHGADLQTLEDACNYTRTPTYSNSLGLITHIQKEN